MSEPKKRKLGDKVWIIDDDNNVVFGKLVKEDKNKYWSEFGRKQDHGWVIEFETNWKNTDLVERDDWYIYDTKEEAENVLTKYIKNEISDKKRDIKELQEKLKKAKI